VTLRTASCKSCTYNISVSTNQRVKTMNRMNKVIFPLILTAASSFALAEGGSERTLHRLNDPETKSTLKELVKEGKVLNIAPAGANGKTDMIQNYRTNAKVQTYEMRVKTPDGKIHTVEFLSTPIGVNNG
ncbi:co-regulatory protein PtrA N-terminal domain-containing protein, partial [Leclercia adecarboxylata]